MIWSRTQSNTHRKTKAQIEEMEKLTSGNLPLSAFPNAKSRRWGPDVDHDTPIEDEKDHLHLPGILDAFSASRWHFYHASAKEVQGESFGKFELGICDIAHFNGIEGICNIWID